MFVHSNRHYSQKLNWPFQKKFIVVLLIMTVQFLIFPAQGIKAENPEAETSSYKDMAVGATGLVLQPVYLAVKLAIGILGTVISGATLVATGGNEEAAQAVLDKSWAGPWGVPELWKAADTDPSPTS